LKRAIEALLAVDEMAETSKETYQPRGGNTSAYLPSSVRWYSTSRLLFRSRAAVESITGSRRAKRLIK